MLKTIREYSFGEWKLYMLSVRGAKWIEIDGYKVRIESPRIRLMLSQKPRRGRVCANCGRLGSKVYLQIETNPCISFPKDKAAFFVYSDDEMMLTCDHVFPRSKGGKTTGSNLQTLCRECNLFKAATIPVDMFSAFPV
jgi:hypothetical protein